MARFEFTVPPEVKASYNTVDLSKEDALKAAAKELRKLFPNYKGTVFFELIEYNFPPKGENNG